MDQLLEKRIRQKVAAGVLGISVRQLKRLLKAYHEEGASGLISKQRGKPSHHQLDQHVVGAALEKLKGKYAGFGPTLAHEKLVEQEGVKMSLGSVRKIMIEEGLRKARKTCQLEVHQVRDGVHVVGNWSKWTGQIKTG